MLHQLFVITETWGITKVYYALGDIWVDDIPEAHQFADKETAEQYRDFYQLRDAVVETVELD